MNSFEMERTLLVGVALTAVCCFFGTLIGLLAKLKGYSFLAWFGTGGSILLAAIILAFQPKVRGTELTREEIDVKIEKGNRIGWILSLFVFVGILLSVTLWLTSMSFEDVEPEMFFQRYWVPAVQWCNWPLSLYLRFRSSFRLHYSGSINWVGSIAAQAHSLTFFGSQSNRWVP
jgi:hypothetical protein